MAGHKDKGADKAIILESFDFLEASKYQFENASHSACLTFRRFSNCAHKYTHLGISKSPQSDH